MSFYYLIDQYNVATTLSYIPTLSHQVVPISNYYFLQQEPSLIQNPILNFQANQTTL